MALNFSQAYEDLQSEFKGLVLGVLGHNLMVHQISRYNRCGAKKKKKRGGGYSMGMSMDHKNVIFYTLLKYYHSLEDS